MTTLNIELEDCRPVDAYCYDEFLNVRPADGRFLRTPLWWYPRLASASASARARIEIQPLGMHWPELDEDISVASMLRGAKAVGAKPPPL